MFAFDKTLTYWRENRPFFLEGLQDFLRIPSISTLESHRPDIFKAAVFVHHELECMGMHNVSIIQGQPGEHPIVYADWMKAPGKPTILLYGHYDVQPVDPLSEWVSAPFAPAIRNGRIYARGAGDDKGQVYIMLKALEGFFKTRGDLPVNVIVLIEGEEESDGQHIARFVRQNASKLAASAAVVLDTGMYAAGMPTIVTGLRGIICAEITCQGTGQDMHSGVFGGAAPNAAEELARIVGSLKTARGRVRIPGFYDGILKPTKAELAAWKKLPFNEEDYRKNVLHAPGLTGDRRYPVLHRIFCRPTLEVNGITGGFTGEGFKTVIPAKASSKISMRLAPGMDPDRIAASLVKFVAKLTPSWVTTEVKIISKDPAMVVDTGNRFVAEAATALGKAFNAETVFARRGGSVPIAEIIQASLKVPVVITGFTLPDCGMHGPNENLVLENFYAGIEGIGRYLQQLST